MPMVGTHARSLFARTLASTILLTWMTALVLGQEKLPWTDPPASQAPASPQPEAGQATPPAPGPEARQPIPPAPEPAASAPARQPESVQPAAVPGPTAPPTSREARPSSSALQNLQAEPRTIPAPEPRTRAATLPRPGPMPRPVQRADVPREERSRALAGAPRPSFDCGYARTTVERAICADPVLAAKDQRMALLYEQRGGSRYRPVDQRQWRWLAAREACARAPRAVLEACIARTYDARIVELSGL
jgi:hypothetical protein